MFVKTRDSTRGSLLNAIKIRNYVQIFKKDDIPITVTCSSDIPPRTRKMMLINLQEHDRLIYKLDYIDDQGSLNLLSAPKLQSGRNFLTRRIMELLICKHALYFHILK